MVALQIGLVLRAWKEIRPDSSQEICAHIVDRSNSVANEEGLDGVKVIRTPRSFASLFSMGDFMGQLDEAAIANKRAMVRAGKRR